MAHHESTEAGHGEEAKAAGEAQEVVAASPQEEEGKEGANGAEEEPPDNPFRQLRVPPAGRARLPSVPENPGGHPHEPKESTGHGAPEAYVAQDVYTACCAEAWGAISREELLESRRQPTAGSSAPQALSTVTNARHQLREKLNAPPGKVEQNKRAALKYLEAMKVEYQPSTENLD